MFGIYLTNFGCMYSETFNTLEHAVSKAKELGFECTVLQYKNRKSVTVKIVKTI